MWASKGFEIAFEQFILQEANMELTDGGEGENSKLNVQKKENEIRIYNDNLDVTFNRKSGFLQNWLIEGKEFLQKGPQLNLWRAPTQNDGGYNPEGNEISRQWVEAGLDCLQHTLKSFKQTQSKDGSIIIMTNYRAQKTGNKKYVDYTTTYTVYPSGKIQVDTELRPYGNIVSFPRVGYTMTVKEGRENFSWYGYGPFDSYNDRHSGARLGIFSGSVDEQFTHHTYPQENGNKYRCLWASLSDDNGIGLIAEGKPYIETSVMHYSLENLSQAENENQLKYTDNVTWNIDYKTYPIGNRSCGSPPLEKYILFAKPVSFSFCIYPIRK